MVPVLVRASVHPIDSTDRAMPASVRMVPSAYDTYLATVATAAAALIGLVNSFVVSLLGLIPKVNIGYTAVIAAVITIVTIARLQQRLHARRSLLVGAVTLLACAVQFGLGVLLLVNPHDSDQLINLCFVVFVTLIVSLQRAWSLLRGRHLAGARGTAVTGDHDPSPRPDPEP